MQSFFPTLLKIIPHLIYSIKWESRLGGVLAGFVQASVESTQQS